MGTVTLMLHFRNYRKLVEVMTSARPKRVSAPLGGSHHPLRRPIVGVPWLSPKGIVGL